MSNESGNSSYRYSLLLSYRRTWIPFGFQRGMSHLPVCECWWSVSGGGLTYLLRAQSSSRSFNAHDVFKQHWFTPCYLRDPLPTSYIYKNTHTLVFAHYSVRPGHSWRVAPHRTIRGRRHCAAICSANHGLRHRLSRPLRNLILFK